MDDKASHGAERAAQEARRIGNGASFDDPPDADEVYEPLTREQAQALRERLPRFTPWRLVTGQALAGLVVTGVWWAVTQSAPAAWSALYGAATVVVPQALMARGITRNRTGLPHAAVLGFVVWELIKVGAVVAMLVAAPWVVPRLSWPALLVGFVVCMKAGWLSLWFRRRSVVVSNEKRD